MATTVTRITSNNTVFTGSASNLISTREMIRNFGTPADFIEMHVYDPAGKRLYSLPNFKGYEIPGNYQPTTGYTIQQLTFKPDVDLQNLGIQFGDYRIKYNIFRPKIVPGNSEAFYIKEISSDRTELRLRTATITNDEIRLNTSNFISEIETLPYFKEYYLNFGEDKLIPFVNVALDLGPSTQTVNATTGVVTSVLTGPPTILVKLINPLPLSYNVNDTLVVVDAISDPIEYSVSITQDPVPVVFPTLRGPNFDLDLDNLRVGPTPYFNFNQITSSQAVFGPLQDLLGQLSASNFAINVDYTNYEDFVHFSSAARRLEGFQYKLDRVEFFTSASASLNGLTDPVSVTQSVNYQNNLNKTIQSFDGWEKYLYYNSGSYTWPKQNSTKPYINYSVTSSEAINWYNSNYSSASLYDDNNQNYLLYAMPGYVTENGDNELAFKFVASIGQMFDDIWIHIKAISDLYKAKNAIDKGISKDLVYFALQSMGIDVYTDEDGTNVFKYLYGISPDGSYKPITGSYDTLVSASNYQISGQDLQKGIYKRLYHNLPLLLKSKGTNRFIQYLNTIFGVPSTVMSYLEYGGVDKVTSSFEYEFDKFTYALNVSSSNTINVPWNYTSQSTERTTFADIVPNGIEFRFKAFPTSSFATQSLFYSGSDVQFNLLYTATASNDSIYSGSTGDFGYFQFKLGSNSITSSTIPVFYTGSNTDSDTDTDWFTVLVQRTNPDLRVGQTNISQTYEFFVKSNVWGEIGHKTSASINISAAANNILWYREGAMTFGGGTYPFSGSLQELRLWSNYISESAFDSHVLNPESIEGNTYSSSFDDLAARWPLGNNLYTYNHTLTSSVASVAPDQRIQAWTASFTNFLNQNNYTSFTETYYADVANSGYANPVTDKVRIVSSSIYGTQLLPNKSIEIQPTIPLTKDIHILDASLSPQDEIDRAIIAAFGSTYNLDDILGNPATGSYNDLTPIQTEFFKKFINKYDYKDYIRLIDFFHNSLFRTLKDFTPARTNLSTGIVIKPHLLERPMVLRPEPQVTHVEYSQSIDTAFITASNGGNYSQSVYNYTVEGKLGPVSMISDARDFFTGVFPSGTLDTFVDQYNPFATFNANNTSSYSESIWNYDYNPLLNNASINRDSNFLKRIDYITSGSRLVQVLSTASIQDFTYTYQRHARPRYFGSKTISTDYNTFSANDPDFWDDGVGPLGRSAVIDKNTIQFAFFSEAVATGSFSIAMPERTNIYIKYLIDATGSLTELTQRNYNNIRTNEFWNLYQVQNIFKPSNVFNDSNEVNISLFDNLNPSPQKTLDGNKVLFDSGFRFSPILWRVGNGVTQTYYIPGGSITGSASLTRTNYTSTVSSEVIRRVTYFKGTARYQPSPLLPLPYDVNVLILLKILPNASLASYPYTLSSLFIPPPYFSYFFHGIIPVVVTIPAQVNGVANYTKNWVIELGGRFGLPSEILIKDVKPTSGVATGLINTYGDSNSWLTVHSESIGGFYQPTNIISCSLTISSLYNEPFYFSGSVISNPTTPTEIDKLNAIYNRFTLTEYPFILTPGDVIRFDTTGSSHPTYTFKPANEYTIIEVYKPTGSNATLTFKVDRKVDEAVTSSAMFGRVERYVISKRIPDETNIVIEHIKAPGPTSAGIIKSNTLKLEIDDNIANIVSELKSKIFSNVLTLGN